MSAYDCFGLVAILIFFGFIIRTVADYSGCDCQSTNIAEILRDSIRASEWRQGDRDE